MLGMIAYVIAAASALGAAVVGLAILLGGSIHLGKEAAIAADKALNADKVLSADKTLKAAPLKTAGTTTGTAAESAAGPGQPAAAQIRTSDSGASSKRKKRNAATRSALQD
jgi:hypothetical protein